MIVSRLFRRLRTEYLLLTAGCITMAATYGLLAVSIGQFARVRDEAVITGATLPTLRASVALLSATIDAEKAFRERGSASREEIIDTYVLPKSAETTRAAHVLTTIAESIGAPSSEHSVVIERMHFEHRAMQEAGIGIASAMSGTRGEVLLRGSFQSVTAFLAIVGLSGELMIGDVLSEQAQQDFLSEMHRASPEHVKAALEFLSTDLLSYAAEPDVREDRILRNATPNDAAIIRGLLLKNGLARVRSVLSQRAATLREKHAWPLPLMRIDVLERKGDLWQIGISLMTRSSTQQP